MSAIHINVDELDLYYQLYKDDIEKNYTKYINFIQSDSDVYADYIKLCDATYELNEQFQCNRKYFIKPSGEIIEQNGGGALTAGLVTGSFVITGVIATMLWYLLNPPEKCKPEYSLYPQNEIPNVGEIIEKILPSNWIKQGIDSGKDITTVLNEISANLDKLTKTFAVFDESAGSLEVRIAKSTTKIGLSVGAAILTVGAGGDKIINVPFFITKGLTMTTKTFNKLFEVTTKMTQTIQKATKLVTKIQTNIDKAVESLDVLDKTKDSVIDSLKSNKTQLAFIYDMFNVNFRNGPFHTICWVDFIMKHYITDLDKVKDIYMLLCVMNDIYLSINDSVISFVGSTLDMIIPESMGLGGTLAPLLKSYSYVLYREVRNEITDRYNDMPIKYRMLIQNPETLSKYLFDKFSTYTLGLSNVVIPESVQKSMSKGIDVLAYGLHNGLSMTYMFLNVFIVFSELNAGINKSLINNNINVEILLRECQMCGSFEVKGMNTDNSYNKSDIDNCTKCKKFYLGDDELNEELDDAELYAKCMVYKGKRDQIKKTIEKVKKSKTYKDATKKATKFLKETPEFVDKTIQKLKDESQKGGFNFPNCSDRSNKLNTLFVLKMIYDNASRKTFVKIEEQDFAETKLLLN